MAIAKFEMPDGRIGRFEVPDGTSAEDAQTMIESHINTDSSYYGRKVKDMGDTGKFLTSAGNRVLDLGRGFKQIYKIGDQNKLAEDIKQSKQLNADLDKTGAGFSGGLVGSIAPVAFTGGVSLPATIGSGVAYGALQPTVGDESRATNMSLGGLASLIGPAIGSATRGLTGLGLGSENARFLMNKGIIPTIGQGINPKTILGNAARGMEELSTSIPWTGSIIKNARDRPRAQFLSTVFKDVSDSSGLPGISKVGHEGIDLLKNQYRNAYDSMLLGHAIPINNSLGSNIDNLVTDKVRYLNDADRQWANNFINRQFESVPLTNGAIDAKHLNTISSNLKSEARGLTGSQNKAQASLGDLLKDTATEITHYRDSFLPENTAEAIKKLDTGYAKFKRIERAASNIGAEEGRFNPSQLYSAIRAMDKSKDKGSFAIGGALMQDMASSGKSVLNNTLADSQTPARMMNASLLSQGLGLVGALPAKVMTSPYLSKYVLGNGGQTDYISELLKRLITPASISGSQY
jgi:hypothetical protein